MFYRVYIHTDTTIHVTSHLDLFIFSRCHSNVQCVEHSFETWEGTMHVYLQPVYIYTHTCVYVTSQKSTYMCICLWMKQFTLGFTWFYGVFCKYCLLLLLFLLFSPSALIYLPSQVSLGLFLVVSLYKQTHVCLRQYIYLTAYKAK